MPSYALLVLPSANRVYAGDAPALMAAELGALDQLTLGGVLQDVRPDDIAGVPYVTFATDAPLDAPALAVVSNVSAIYALFERTDDALRPVATTPLARWDDSLLTIPRYAGKTNEQLTKLLLNLTTAAAAGTAAFTGTALRVLDPLCGRGTTLHQAVVQGHHAAGIDIDKRDVDAYVHFFTTWLKDKRAKHASKRMGTKHTISFAPDKVAPRQEVVVVADDTLAARNHFAKSSFDAVVTDLPYGVQHGSQADQRLQRRPGDLLDDALPVWRAVLRPGGAIGISWNTKVLPRADAEGALASAGFTVVDGEAFERFSHRVDHAIERDLVVARRPASS